MGLRARRGLLFQSDGLGSPSYGSVYQLAEVLRKRKPCGPGFASTGKLMQRSGSGKFHVKHAVARASPFHVKHPGFAIGTFGAIVFHVKRHPDGLWGSSVVDSSGGFFDADGVVLPQLDIKRN